MVIGLIRVRPSYSSYLNSIRLALALLLVCVAASCGRRGAGGDNGEAAGIVVVNAPAAGVVRRVLVSEGASVNEGAGIVEITVRAQTQGAQAGPTEDPVARAATNYESVQKEIEAARAAVVQAEVEVRRLEPLVAAGQASQGELDGARAVYERAQQKFQRLQSSAQSAQSGIVAARQQELNGSRAATAPAEQTVVARATSAGRVAVVNVRVGDVVTMGQPLATLRAGDQ